MLLPPAPTWVRLALTGMRLMRGGIFWYSYTLRGHKSTAAAAQPRRGSGSPGQPGSSRTSRVPSMAKDPPRWALPSPHAVPCPRYPIPEAPSLGKLQLSCPLKGATPPSPSQRWGKDARGHPAFCLSPNPRVLSPPRSQDAALTHRYGKSSL